MHILSLTLSVILLSANTLALSLPTRRETAVFAGSSITNNVEQAIISYLSTHNASGDVFRIAAGPRAIAVSGSESDTNLQNNNVYHDFDTVYTSDAHELRSFSEYYMAFVDQVYDEVTAESPAVGVLAAENTQIRTGMLNHQSFPSYTMPISNGSAAGDVDYAPLYSINHMDDLLGAWSTGKEFSSFNYPSFQSLVSPRASMSSSPTPEKVNLVWDSPPDPISKRQRTTNSSTLVQSMELDWRAAKLMSIQYGSWFDVFQSARVLERSSLNATTSQGKSVFNSVFGNETNPGSLGLFNGQALVVYQPTMTLQFPSGTDELDQFLATEGECYSFICTPSQSTDGRPRRSADADSSLNIDYVNKRITWKGIDKVGYVLGYVQYNYWKMKFDD